VRPSNVKNHVMSYDCSISPIFSPKSALLESVRRLLLNRAQAVLQEAHLNISVKTTKKHRANIIEKLDLRHASSLTTCAIERGLVEKEMAYTKR